MKSFPVAENEGFWFTIVSDLNNRDYGLKSQSMMLVLARKYILTTKIGFYTKLCSRNGLRSLNDRLKGLFRGLARKKLDFTEIAPLNFQSLRNRKPRLENSMAPIRSGWLSMTSGKVFGAHWVDSEIQYLCQKLTLFKKSKIAYSRGRHFGSSLNLPHSTSDSCRAGCEHSRHGSFHRPGARRCSVFFVGVGCGRKPYFAAEVTM